MAPKKAMKSTKAGLEKSPMVKKVVMKKAKAKAKAKAADLEKSADQQNKLNRSNLEKLGQLSLKEKIANAAKEGEDMEEAAEILQSSMTKQEKNLVWGRHQTALKNGQADQAEYEEKTKKQKGLAAAQWLMQTEGKKYIMCQKSVSASESWTRNDSWQTELQMLKKFTAEELNLHIESGRVVWRECPSTYGTWEYKDLQDWSRELKAKRGKHWEQGTEFDPEEESLEKFSQLYNQDAMHLGSHDIADTPAKGQGKSLGKGKGKGFGKAQSAKGGKGKPRQLALKDKEYEEEEESQDEETSTKDVLKKAKKARDLVQSTQSDLALALEKAKASLSRAGKAAAAGLDAELGKVLTQLKAILSGKSSKAPNDTKKVLEESAKIVKAAKEEAKELKMLGNKAASAAGSSGSKKTRAK